MNEHAIYEIVGTKRQRYVFPISLEMIFSEGHTCRPSLAGLRKQWCPEIIDLIERMWTHEHQDRPTMSEIVEALDELVAQR